MWVQIVTNAPTSNDSLNRPGLSELMSPELKPLISKKQLWPKDLAKIVDLAMGELEPLAIDHSDKKRILEALLLSLSFKSGGRGLYLPQANRLKTAIRNHWIYRDSHSLSVQELANKYGLSINAVYKAIKDQKTLMT